MITPASGRLLGLVAADLSNHSLIGRSDGLAAFVAGDGTEIVVGSRVKKRFLGRTEIARFRVVTPVGTAISARLRIRQTGTVRRGTVTAEVVDGPEEADLLARRLAGDPEFVAAAARLDFTSFDVVLEGGECIVTVELMGASLVAIALPPIRSYVRLHSDQRDALTRCLRRLGEIVT